jgi:type I restriction enzyme S subunit
MVGLACSEDVLRVVPDAARISPGYLYAFLSSRYGVPLVVSGTYGAIIQHIEPEHIRDIDIPRFGREFEDKIGRWIQEAAKLRSEFQTGIIAATRRLLSDAGVNDCPPHEWHELEAEIGFPATIALSRSMRAMNYSPRVRRLIREVEQAGAVRLADICRGGQLNTGARFRYAPLGIFAADESVLVASSGTLGENEVYCRPILVTGRWTKFAYSQHFLRIVSGDPRFSGAYLFAYLRSELAFRALRSMSTGSKQQEIHVELVGRLPVPLLDGQKRQEIAKLVRDAFRLREKADAYEADAVAEVESAISGGGAVRWPK